MSELSADLEVTTGKHAGFVSIIGAPNAGKSTLLNRFVGSKLAIVTPKVQTTRTRILGIVNRGKTQIVFIDTPGIVEPKHRLERAMMQAAWGSLRDADINIVLFDALDSLLDSKSAFFEALAKELTNSLRPAVLVLNKIDVANKPQLLETVAGLTSKHVFEAVFMISALTGDGVDVLMDWVASNLPIGAWYYPEDQISDVPMRQLAAEVTREKLFMQLHHELPYSLTVETESWDERADGSISIKQKIFVKRSSQRAIVLGKHGHKIREVGISARQSLKKLLGCEVHLNLYVKVRGDWTDDRKRYEVMGLDFPE